MVAEDGAVLEGPWVVVEEVSVEIVEASVEIVEAASVVDMTVVVEVAVDSAVEIAEDSVAEIVEDSEEIAEAASVVGIEEVSVVDAAVAPTQTWSKERTTGHVINVEIVISLSDGNVISAKHHDQMEVHREEEANDVEEAHQEETDIDHIKHSSYLQQTPALN